MKGARQMEVKTVDEWERFAIDTIRRFCSDYRANAKIDPIKFPKFQELVTWWLQFQEW